MKKAAASRTTKLRSTGSLSSAIRGSLPSGTLEFFRELGKPPEVSQTALVRKYWGWVYSCVNSSAVRIASTPLKLYASRWTGQSKVSNFQTKAVDKKKVSWLRSRCKDISRVAGAEDFEEIEEHPLLDMLQSVNDFENGFETWELTSSMLDLTGNAYWYVERDGMGTPSKMFLLRSQWVRIIPDAKTFVAGYRYGVDQMKDSVLFSPDEVIHFKYPNPLDPWYGFGPTQAAAYAIESAELRERFILATLRNMGRPDLVVKYMEGELDRAERIQLEREWNAMFQGPKNAGKVKVTDFRYEIDKLGWNPSELDFNRGEDWVMKKICAEFPVPIGLVDTSQISRAPRAGMEGADLFMAQFNTLPRCTRIEQKMNEKLCPMFDDRLFVAFENPVPKDSARQLNEDNVRLANYSITINELRKREGEEPVPWGDVPLVGMGIAPLGASTTPPGQGPAAGLQSPEIPEGEIGQSGGAIPVKEEDPTTKLEEKGYALTIEGSYLHPTLDGIPIRLSKIRNEHGRFDAEGPDKLHGRRSDQNVRLVMEGAKGE